MTDSGDEGAAAGGASVPRALAAYDRDAERVRQRRLLLRGGAPPTDASERRKSKAEIYTQDTRPAAILAAIEYRCDCDVQDCVGRGRVHADLVRECRVTKRDITNIGLFFRDALRDAVLQLAA